MSDTDSSRVHYKEFLTPFPSSNEADNAMKAFFEDLELIREKYRIADALCTICIPYLEPDNNEVVVISSSYAGDPMKRLSLSAHAFGTAQKVHDEGIANVLEVCKRE